MGGETEVLKLVMILAQITTLWMSDSGQHNWQILGVGPRSPSLGPPDSQERLRLLRTPTPIRLKNYWRDLRSCWETPVLTKERLESRNQMPLQDERTLAASELWVGRLQTVRDGGTARRHTLSPSLHKPPSPVPWGASIGHVSVEKFPRTEMDPCPDGYDMICHMQFY